MEQLRGRDAHHLAAETASQPMHTLKVVVLDAAAMPGGYSFERLGDFLIARAGRQPPLRRRLVPARWPLAYPSWDDPGRLDANRHLRRAVAEPPGGPRELCAIASRLAGQRLDRTAPLWDVWVVEGLERGRVALVFRIHHTLADGLASAQLLTDLFGIAEEDDAAPRAPEPAGPGEGLFPLLKRTIAATVGRRRRRARGEPMPVAPFDGPFTRFNHRLTPYRSCAWVSAPLADVLALRAALGCTVNDVILAVVGGAVRSHLLALGELPRESLTAHVPLSVRTPAERRAAGNRVSALAASLYTDRAGTVARLRGVQASMHLAKERHDPSLWAAWWDYAPLVSGYIRLASYLAGMTTRRPPYNVIVSNVRGPTQPLQAAGAPVVALFSIGPIAYALGLNVTVWSYLDRLNFGVVGCRAHLPNAWALAERIPAQLAELKQAAGEVVPLLRRC